MKKVLLSVFSFCLLTIGLQAQSTFYSESFEDTLGWKLSNQFDDGYEDYSLRDSVSKINARTKGPDFQIMGADSNFVLAFEDINSGDPGSAPSNGEVVLTLDSIPINGYDNLELTLAIAGNPTSNKYDNAKNWFGSNGNGDTVSVWGKIDNGNYVKLMYFCAKDSNAAKTSSSNTGSLYFDANQNYIGGEKGETAVNDTLSDFKAKITGKGMYLTIKVELRVEAGDEEVILDNFRVSGKKSAGPKPIPHYGLGVVTTEDASGVADSANVACSVSGVVHGIDMSGLVSSSNTFQLIDATGHITVYKKSGFTPSYTVNESDSVTLYGKVTQNNGLTQFTPDSIKVHGNGAGLKSWKKVSKLDESTESDYIRIDSVRLLNASQWPKIGNNAYTVDILTQSGDTLTLNIDKDSYVDDSVAAPAGMFDVIGYGGQFDSKPYTSGYTILPQLKNHIIIYAATTCDAPSALMTVSKTNVEVELGWTSGGSNTWNIEWGTMGSSATVITSTTNPHKFSGLMAATSYVFRVQDSCIGLGVSPWSGWDTIMTDAVAKVIPTYPISTVRTVDSNGVADSLDVMCYLHGVVITPTYREVGSGYEFHINDKSSPLNGINVIRFSGAEYVPRVGDSVKIFGKIDQYNGHIQMKALADSIWVLDSNKTVPMAMATGKLDETTESKLLLLNSWEIIDTTGWPTANYGNYDITNGTDTTIMRMDGDRNWATNMPSPPLGKFCVIGVGGQYDGSKPHSASYQILPRDSNDFIACPPACKESTDLETDSITDNSVSVKWTTGGATTWNVGWAKGHASTEPSDSVMGVTTNPYTITGIDAGQHYHIWIQDVCAFNESKWAGPTMFTTLATGINNVDGNKASLIAFPNPNNIGEVRFNMEVTVTVRNILGQTVKSAKEVTSLDISDLDSGVYLIQSEEGDTIRFIVE